MELTDFTNKELQKIADETVVDLDGATAKKDMVAVLQKNNIDVQTAVAAVPELAEKYEEQLAPEKDDESAAPEPEVTPPEKTSNPDLDTNAEVTATAQVQPPNEEEQTAPTTKEVLVKMERRNAHFEAYGKVFKRSHPFVVCDEKIANKILTNFTGFKIATPAEAQEYYGG